MTHQDLKKILTLTNIKQGYINKINYNGKIMIYLFNKLGQAYVRITNHLIKAFMLSDLHIVVIPPKKYPRRYHGTPKCLI